MIATRRWAQRSMWLTRWTVAAGALALSGGLADARVLVSGGTHARAASGVERWLRGLALAFPRGTITIVLAPCPEAPSVDGCAASGTIWLRPSSVDRAILLHELGHQFDYTQPSWARATFAALNHDRRPWDAAPNGPGEQFAEAWMGCAAPALAAARYDGATGRYGFAYGYRPTPSDLTRTCRLIRRAGRAGARQTAASAPHVSAI